ncbi:hypothetical protein APUTEX25_002111, partial [Auxenochlorella protothecoides]
RQRQLRVQGAGPPPSLDAPSSMNIGVAKSWSDRMVPGGTVTRWLLPLLFTAAWKASSFSTLASSAVSKEGGKSISSVVGVTSTRGLRPAMLITPTVFSGWCWVLAPASRFTASAWAWNRVEVQARHEVEEKREQLRQLIGGSYRELLATSDAVIDIHESAKQVVGLVSRIQSQMQAVAEAVGKSNADNRLASPTSKSSTERLYDVGIRVKFLLDTPEHVWGCLDACDFLGAACRFLAASDAHRALTGRGKHGVAAQFPLLQHQWPLVRKFRGEVQGRAGEWLRDGAGAGDVPARDIAATLAALALLKP